MTQPDTAVPAALRLQVAVDQLIQPEQVRLDRDPGEVQAAIDALTMEHLHGVRELRHRHGQVTDAAARTRLINGMTIAGALYRRTRARLIAELAEDIAVLPSLLEQLRDAVTSAGGYGNAARGPYRSPLNSTAVEIIAAIEREVGRGDLADQLKTWRQRCTESGQLLAAVTEQAADLAERWVIEARAILQPARWIEAARPCPACGTRHVWVHEDGQNVCKAAIQINVTDGYAACCAPSCGAHWPRTHFDLLAAALQQEDIPS